MHVCRGSRGDEEVVLRLVGGKASVCMLCS